MPSNLLRRRSGPAFIHRQGVSFFTKDAITFDPQINDFAVEDDANGAIDHRLAGRSVKLQYTPGGVWTAAMLAVHYPAIFQNFQVGQYNTPKYDISAVTVAAPGVFTSDGNNILTGTGVRFASTGTLPTGLDALTTYYIASLGADTFSVSDTEAHAIAGTNLVAITGAGSGSLIMVQNTPTIVQYLDAAKTQVVLWNSGVTKLPDLDLSAVKTPYGACEIEGYALHGTNVSDDNSVFSVLTGGTLTCTVDPTTIPTVPYSAAFGGSAPFSDLQPRDGVAVSFSLKLTDVKDDANGVLCKRIEGVDVGVKLRPLNVLDTDLLGELKLQGTGAAIGASLASQALTVSGPSNNPYFQLAAASLVEGPLKIGTKEDRVGDINFKSKRIFSAGVAQPIFFVGVAAP